LVKMHRGQQRRPHKQRDLSNEGGTKAPHSRRSSEDNSVWPDSPSLACLWSRYNETTLLNRERLRRSNPACF
jgi:hypothetical protein